jgi:hypothetical protein
MAASWAVIITSSAWRAGQVQIGLGIFDRFLGCLAGRIGPLFIQVFAAHSGIGQDGHAIGLHFEDAACHEHKLLAAVGHLDAHRARFGCV